MLRHRQTALFPAEGFRAKRALPIGGSHGAASATHVSRLRRW